MDNMGQIIFVVCRESIEALLVIGILWAWMSKNSDTLKAKRFLIAGIIAGLGLAVLLALALVGVTTFLGEEAQQWFEIGMLAFATCLIVQMVMWMRKHGRTLKKELEQGLEQNVVNSNWWGVFFLAMIAVGREGSESVLFLYGSFAGLAGQGIYAYLLFFVATTIGIALAMLLFYLLQIGSRFISWRIFFRVTEILLLFLGVSLLLTSGQNLMNGPLAIYDLPSWMYGTVWDSSNILSDSSVFGNLMASLFGYRSQPIAFDLMLFVGYWVVVLTLFSYTKSRAKE